MEEAKAMVVHQDRNQIMNPCVVQYNENKELQKRNQYLPEDDWSSQNVKCNDNQIWKY